MIALEQLPTVDGARLPWISTSDMVEIDRIMIEELHIGLIQMMENAGRHLAEVVRLTSSDGPVMVAAGSGGNGGGGLVAARHLANQGRAVRVLLTSAPERFGPVPARQLDIVHRMAVPVVEDAGPARLREWLVPGAVLVDAMVGYSVDGGLRGVPAAVAAHVDPEVTVVSLDAPSGVDTTTGADRGALRADVTVTLCLPKQGLRHSEAIGRLVLADISVPPSVTSAWGTPPPFANGPLLRVV